MRALNSIFVVLISELSVVSEDKPEPTPGTYQNTENPTYTTIAPTSLNLRSDNFNSMNQKRKPGRPREWVLNEEIIEIHRLSTELRTQNPKVHWSSIKGMLKTRLEQMKRKDLLLKLDRLCGLMKRAIPLPPRCICGNNVYSYTYRKVESKYEHYWEIFARCMNPECRYLRRYLPSARYIWSRPKSAAKELEKTPTFYQMDGQKVEEAK